MILFGLVGGGGLGSELIVHSLPSVMAKHPEVAPEDIRVVYVDSALQRKTFLGMDVLSEEEFLAAPATTRYFNIAIGNGRIREEVAKRLEPTGAKPISLMHETTDIRVGSSVGDGAIFTSRTTVTANSAIGRYFLCQGFSYVAHDCVVGDFVSFAGRVCCNGNVHIGNHVTVGTGALLRQGTEDKPLKVGDGATIGMGAVVTKDVPAGATVVGNPARPLSSSREKKA